MSAHTPGPWRHRGVGIVTAQERAVAVDRRGHRPLVAAAYTSLDEWEANARLIVAAPDLLAALQALVAELDGPGKPYSSDSYAPPHFIETAKAAIAKATDGDSK